jgi:HSP20 family protein
MSVTLSKSGTITGQYAHSLRAAGWQVSVRSYAWSPPTDVYETEASFVVRIEVAGIGDADFKIQVQENLLTVSGTRSDSQERRAYRQMEIRYGEFSTAVELPPGLDIQRAAAEYENGFLTIIFPKLKPTGIAIQG